MARRLTLIAGSGALVPDVARALSATGEPLQIVSLEARPALSASEFRQIAIEDPKSIIEAVRAFKTSHLVMAGAVHISDLARERIAAAFGAPGRFAGSMGDIGIASLLLVYSRMIGVQLIGAHQAAPGLLAPRGTIAGPEPTRDILAFASRALRVARAVGRLDLGQAVVLSGRRVVAAEDTGGTDALLERIADLKRRELVGNAGHPLILAKARKPRQPAFLDLPSIGPATVINAAGAGISVVIVEAGRSLLLERERLIAEANERGVTVIGMGRRFG